MKRLRTKISKIICLVLTLFSFSQNYAFAKKATIYSGVVTSLFGKQNSSNPKLSRVRQLNDDMIVTEVFEFLPEKKYKTKKNNIKNEHYKKKIIVTKEFEKKKKNGEYELCSKYETKIIFTYNKKSSVSVKTSATPTITKGNRVLMVLEEIFPDPEVCLVSNKFTLYKKGMLGHTYTDESYIDIFCSVNGDLGINTDLD